MGPGSENSFKVQILGSIPPMGVVRRRTAQKFAVAAAELESLLAILCLCSRQITFKPYNTRDTLINLKISSVP